MSDAFFLFHFPCVSWGGIFIIFLCSVLFAFFLRLLFYITASSVEYSRRRGEMGIARGSILDVVKIHFHVFFFFHFPFFFFSLLLLWSGVVDIICFRKIGMLVGYQID